ncbi:FxSxx-COOH system tetratricopeptide repeat protein [Herbidospora sp. RD11066]
MAYESANAGSRPRNPLTPFAAASDMEPLIIGGQLPVKVNFTGRAGEVLRLRHVLACRHDAPTCLVGQGGTGKTQIAREYIRRFESIYEVIWWVRAEDPSLINASLASLASQLNLDITDPHFRQVLFDTLRSPEHTGRWLIVYDNVEDPSSITPFLPLGGGDVLITTRDRRWIQAGYIIEIDSFSRADSVAVILDRAPHLSEIESQLISDKVGDLPIAVVQAATYIAETGISAPEYMRLLDERTAEILDEGLPADYQASLTSTWLLSLDHLAKTCPPAVSLLHRCAFFGAESIPRELLKEGALPLAGDSAEVFRDPLMLGVAIRELQRFGLMRMDAGELRLQMHRLLRSLLRQKMSKRLRQSCRHDVHLLLVGAYKSKSMESNNDPILSQIVGHAHASQLNRCSNSAAKTLSGVLDQYLQSPTADEIRTTSRQWHPSSAGTSILINLEDSDWLRLTKQLARGDCFPIFGPDSSKQYQDALRSVSKRIAHECGYPGNDVTALPYVAEYASMSMPSRSDFGHYVANLIREELQDDPTEIQRLLSSFPIDSYFIETFDGSLKRGLEEAGRIPATRISDLFDELWGRGTAIENPTPERPLIFHYMGAYSAPETMILRYSDHVNLRFREAESEWVGQHHWPIHIRSSISSRPLLFIGPAIWSPHGILEGAARRIPRSNRRRHIFVIDSSTIDTSNASRDQLVDLVMSRLPGDWSASLFIGSIDSFAAELRARLESQQSSNQSA